MAGAAALAILSAGSAHGTPAAPPPGEAPPAPAASTAPSTVASDLGALSDWHEVRGALATVLVPDEALVPWAREVAVRADRAVRLAAAFWGVPPPRTHVVVDDRDDVYNASVDPLPDPVIHLRTRAPAAGELGFAARDPLLLLLIHEAIHAVHLGGRPGSLPLPTGIVGTHVPWPPPSWLLEGVAVWAESRLTPGGGGRLDAPDTRGVLRLLAVEGPWPSLSDASLLTHDAWPAGEVRYLLGGAFVERLVDRHGAAALRGALRRYETQAPWLGFAHAWRVETGGDLHAEWAGLRRDLIRAAEARGEGAGGERPHAVAPGRAPALAPDGRRLAWVADGAVRVATLSALRARTAGAGDGPSAGREPPRNRREPAGVRTLPLRAAPERLTWWGDDRLAYARVRPTRDGRLRELVALSLIDGRERVLSEGARAYDPAPLPGGCLAFVRDTAPGGSELRRWCEDGPAAGEPLWVPPDGTRIVGLAASAEGRLAAVLWREGRTRLVELEGATPQGGMPVGVRVSTRDLPAPPGTLRDPVWDGEHALLIASDAAGGIVESWRVDLRTGRTERRTSTLGGVVGHAPGVAAERRVGGPVLTWVADGATTARDDGATGPAGAATASGGSAPDPGGAASVEPLAAPGPARPYRPLGGLRALGWLPEVSPAGAGVRLLAADPTRTVAVVGTAGVAWGARPGPLGPAYLGATLLAGEVGPVPVPGRPAPLEASVRVGVLPYRPHLGTETVLVPRLDLAVVPLLAVSPTVRARLGVSALALPEGIRPALEGRLAAADGRADPWGVPRRGWSAAATIVADPVPGGGTSAGAWLDGAVWRPAPALSASTALGARVGWRAPSPVPAGAWGDAAASAAAELGWTVPVAWRLGDGRLALERVRASLGVRGLVARGGGAWAASAGPEARLAADLVAGYGAPVSFGLAAGGQWGADGGAWLRLEAPGPFF